MERGKKYVVKQGDCLSKIGYEHGIYWKTIYDHSENAAFKNKRKNPDVIYPGDVIFIPNKEEKKEIKSDAKKHSFKKKGTPANLRIRLLENDEPLSNVEYLLIVDGKIVSEKEAKTDNDGILEHSIDPDAQKGELFVGEDRVEYILNLGCLDPVETDEGVQGRLYNLGHYTGIIDGNLEETVDAIRQFQQKYKDDGLSPTGKIDDITRDKLKKIHGM